MRHRDSGGAAASVFYLSWRESETKASAQLNESEETGGFILKKWPRPGENEANREISKRRKRNISL